MSVLKIDQLVCGYDAKKPVIKGVSFSVYDGEFVGIGTPSCPEKMDLIHREK